MAPMLPTDGGSTAKPATGGGLGDLSSVKLKKGAPVEAKPTAEVDLLAEIRSGAALKKVVRSIIAIIFSL